VVLVDRRTDMPDNYGTVYTVITFVDVNEDCVAKSRRSNVEGVLQCAVHKLQCFVLLDL
jgi:hypothetical protein